MARSIWSARLDSVRAPTRWATSVTARRRPAATPAWSSAARWTSIRATSTGQPNSSYNARASSSRERRIASAGSASASTSIAPASAHRSPRVARVLGGSDRRVARVVGHPARQRQLAHDDPRLGDVERSRRVERRRLRQLPRLVGLTVAQRQRQQHAGDDRDLAVAGRSRHRQRPFARAACLLDVAADEEQAGEHRHRIGDESRALALEQVDRHPEVGARFVEASDAGLHLAAVRQCQGEHRSVAAEVGVAHGDVELGEGGSVVALLEEPRSTVRADAGHLQRVGRRVRRAARP